MATHPEPPSGGPLSGYELGPRHHPPADLPSGTFDQGFHGADGSKGLGDAVEGGGPGEGNEGGYILETSPDPGADRRLGLGSEELSILHLKPYR